MEIKLAAFDMDGTLLEKDSSWAALHKHFGTTKEGKEGLKLYTTGEIDYEEFMRRDISSWPKDLTVSEVERILLNYKVRREAPYTVNKMKELGIEVVIVTAGIDILAKRVADGLGIKTWIANGLRADENGRLTGEGIGRVDPSRKDLAFNGLLARLSLDRRSTIAVGDTIYDITFLRAAGLGFLLSKTDLVDDPTIIRINNLKEIFPHVETKV